MSSHPPLTVVGAGLSGALLAIYLARRGHRVTLYERRPDPRQGPVEGGRSINLALSVRGIAALEAVGLAEQVLATTIPMPGRILHDRAGNTVYSPYSAFPEREWISSVERVGLNRILIEAADAEPNLTIVFERRCVGLDLDARRLKLRGPDGALEEVEAPHVIGADGAFSAVRAALVRRPRFDYSQDYLPTAYKELTMPAAPGGGWRIEKGALHIWPRGDYMLIALPNQDGTFTVTLFWPYDGEHGADALAADPPRVQAFFEREFPDAVPHLPDLVEEFQTNPTGALATIRVKPWHLDDRALVVGDAAHAVVPFYGQGMNAAMEDCLILDRCLEAHPGDLAAAFAAFEQARWADADALQDLAIEHYLEMRDSVASPAFQRKKKLEQALQRSDPEGWKTLYSMVTFSTEPYAAARERARAQDRRLLRAIPDLGAALDPRVAHRLTAESRCATRPGPGAVSALAAALTDPDPAVRVRAARELGSLGPHAAGATDALVARLDDADPEVAELAAEALGRIGPAGAFEAVKPLVGLLAGERDGPRAAAAWALGELGKVAYARGAYPPLKELATSPRAGFLEALFALGRLENPTPVELLIATLDHEQSFRREAAATALGGLARFAAPALNRLAVMRDDPEEDAAVREAARTAAAAIEAKA